MIGVSPAYFFSRFSTDFTVAEIASALPDLKGLGFDGFQLEVFHPHRLPEWLREGRELRRRAADLGMRPTQFVAHFLLAGFESEESLDSGYGYDEIKTVLDILEGFPGCDLVTVPLPAFAVSPTKAVTADRYVRLWDRLKEKIRFMLAAVEKSGRRMALEISPWSLAGGIGGFLRLCDELESPTLGFNFDTGHAWSCKETISLIPARLGKRIYGTHLKDNFGAENLALPPGRGSVPWDAVISGLRAAGYRGSWDLEIACSAPEVESFYREGLAFIKHRIQHTL